MINGAHVIVYSSDAEADRAFVRDVLGYESADAGGGWLILRCRPRSWPSMTAIKLPGGGELGLYEPRHPSPLPGIGP